MPNIGGFINKATSPGFWGTLGRTVLPLDLFNDLQRKKLMAHYGGAGGGIRGFFQDYFSGAAMPGWGLPQGVSSSQAQRMRRYAGMAAGGMLAANYLAPHSGITGLANTALGITAHSTIARALYGAKKPLGIGYGIWAGLNALRPGDNLGPF